MNINTRLLGVHVGWVLLMVPGERPPRQYLFYKAVQSWVPEARQYEE